MQRLSALADRGAVAWGWAWLTAGLALAAPGTLFAQVPALPMAPDPFLTNVDFGPANEVALLVGGSAFGDDTEIGTPWAVALRRRVHPRVTLHAAGGAYAPLDSDGDSATEAQLGAAADVVLLDAARLIVTAHGGVGYLGADDGRVVTVPLGAGITVELFSVASVLPSFLTTPSLGGNAVYLWALPRVEILNRERGRRSQTEPVAAAAFGIGIAGSENIGIHVGFDGRTDPSPESELPPVPAWTWGLSIRYRI